MKNALLDTDAVSYYFRNNQSAVETINPYIIKNGFVYLSVITYYEILNGLYYKDAKQQLSIFLDFANLNTIIPINSRIATKAAQIYSDLRQKGKTSSHTDVLIAATAIVSDLTLITNNTKHFGSIKELDFKGLY